MDSGIMGLKEVSGMVILIAGASHTGKTVLAQKLLEQYNYPYFSIDHLKMGLIRSGKTQLTPCDDDQLVDYLWPIVAEMIKTAIENSQNLIVEGCYIPFDWADCFDDTYLKQIRYCCLVMSERYIDTHFDLIRTHADDVEKRLDDSGLTKESLARENQRNLAACIDNNLTYLLIDENYNVNDQIGGVLWPM